MKHSVGELLDRWWELTQELDPRQAPSASPCLMVNPSHQLVPVFFTARTLNPCGSSGFYP